MFRYFMIALFCFVVAKTVRIVHYANPTAQPGSHSLMCVIG